MNSFLILVCLLPQIAVASFEYGEGIADWPAQFCYANEGRQSPINFDMKSTTPCPADQKRINFRQYNKKVALEGVNNGHSVQFNLKDTVAITGGGLKGSYKLLQLHFHWGSNNKQGSEHTLNGKPFPIELHFVHQAEKDDDPTHKYAVVGVFFRIGKPNKGIGKLVKVMDQLIKPNENTAEVSGFNLMSLLPRNRSFFRYAGSLTTPTCDEAVIWSSMKNPITISKKQLEAFRTLQNDHGQNLEDNFRPTQELNDREVQYCKVKK